MTVGEVLARRHELALVLLPAPRVQPAPGRVDLQEGVLDEMTRAHARRLSQARASVRSRPRLSALECERADRPRLAVLLDLSGRRDAPHRGARGELRAQGHEARILAPYDPDDALSARLHRGARPQAASVPERSSRSGARSASPPTARSRTSRSRPHAVLALRRELREGGYDVAHIHEPVVPWSPGMPSAPPRAAARRHLPHLLGERPHQRLRRRAAGRAPADEPPARPHRRLEAAAWTARRFFGGRYRIVPNGVHLEPRPRRRRTPGARRAAQASRCASCSSARPSSARACRCCCGAFEALREHVPATLTLVGASREEVAHMMLDDRGVRALGKVSERASSPSWRAPTCCARRRSRRELRHGPDRGLRRGTPVLASDIPGYRDVVRDGLDGLLVPPGDALALAEALRELALDPRGARSAWRPAPASAPSASPGRTSPAKSSTATSTRSRRRIAPPTRLARLAVRHGLAPADLLPARARAAPAEPAADGPAARPTWPASRARAAPRRAASLSLARRLGARRARPQRVGLTRVAASLLASKPGLVARAWG